MMGTHNQTLWRKTAGVAAFVGILAFASACGTNDSLNDPIPSTESSASTSASTASEATDAPTSPETPTDPALGTPSPTGKLVSSSTGDYLQSVMSPEDPAMKLIPATLDVSAESTNKTDILEAQKFIVSFMAEQGIDSPLNGAGMTPEEWFAQNENVLSPAYKEEFRQSLSEGKPFVLNEKWQQEKYGDKYRYMTSADKPRIYDRIITPKKVWVLETGSIAVQADISYKMPVTPGVGLIGTGVQSTSGVMTYSVIKDPATGKWLIDGYQHDVNTLEG